MEYTEALRSIASAPRSGMGAVVNVIMELSTPIFVGTTVTRGVSTTAYLY